MAEDRVFIAHQGKPCDPPIVDGIEFTPLDDASGLWIGACTEEQAAHTTRIPQFVRYGGQPPRKDLTGILPALADALADAPSGDPLEGVIPPPTDTAPSDAGEVPPPPPTDEPTDSTGDDDSESGSEDAGSTDDGAPSEEATDTTGNKYPAKKKKRR